MLIAPLVDARSPKIKAETTEDMLEKIVPGIFSEDCPAVFDAMLIFASREFPSYTSGI